MSSSSSPAVSGGTPKQPEVDLSHVSTGAAFINSNLPSYRNLGTTYWRTPNQYFENNGALGQQMGCNIPAYYCFTNHNRGGGGGGRGGFGDRGGHRGRGGHAHVDPAAAPDATGPPALPKDTLEPLNPNVDCSMSSAPNTISGLYMCKVIEALSNPSCTFHPRFESEKQRELESKALLASWGITHVEGSYYEAVKNAIDAEWDALLPHSRKGAGKPAVGAATELMSAIRQALTTLIVYHRVYIKMPQHAIDRTMESAFHKKGTKEPKELFFALRSLPQPPNPDDKEPIDVVLSKGAGILGVMKVGSPGKGSMEEEPVQGIDKFAKVRATIYRQQVHDAHEVIASDNHAAKPAAKNVLGEEKLRTWAPHEGMMSAQVIRTGVSEEEEDGGMETPVASAEPADASHDDEENATGIHHDAPAHHRKKRAAKITKADLAGQTTSSLAQCGWFDVQPPRASNPHHNTLPQGVNIHAKAMKLHTHYIAPAMAVGNKGVIPMPFEDNKKSKANVFRAAALAGATTLRWINDAEVARATLASQVLKLHNDADKLRTPRHDETASSKVEEFSKKIYAFDVALGGVHSRSGSEHEDNFWVKHMDRLILQVLVPSSEPLRKLPLKDAVAWIYRCQTQEMSEADIARVSAMPGVVDAMSLFGVMEDDDGLARAPITDSVLMSTYGQQSRGSTAICSAAAATKRLEVVAMENTGRARMESGDLAVMRPNDRNPAATAIRRSLVQFVMFTHYAELIMKLPFMLVVQPSTKFCAGQRDGSLLQWKPIGEFDGLILRVTIAGAVVHRVLEMKSNLADLAGAAKQRDRLGMTLWKAMNRPPLPGPTTAEDGTIVDPPFVPVEKGAGSGVDTPVDLTVGDIMIQLCPVRDQAVPAYLLRIFPLLQHSFSGLPTSPFNPSVPMSKTPLDHHYRALVRTWVYVSCVVLESVKVRGREEWKPSMVPHRLVGGGSFRHVLCGSAAMLAARDFPTAYASDNWLADRTLKPLVSGCNFKIRMMSVEKTLNAFTNKPHSPQAIIEELRTLGCLENLLLLPSAADEE